MGVAQKNDRLKELDALRGLAALSIVFYHYLYRYDVLYGHSFSVPAVLRYLRVAVPLFFILSGFVIFWSLNRKRHLADFAVARFSRLYPAYWAAVVLTSLVLFCAPLEGRSVSPVQVLINFTMLQQFLFVPHVDGVYWTLTVELVFYFWMGLLCLLGVARWFEKIATCWIAGEMLFVVLAPESVVFRCAEYVLLLRYGHLFFAGVVLYRIWQERCTAWRAITICFSLLANFVVFDVVEATIICSLYILFWLAVSGSLRFLSFGPFLWLGAISYPLYLVHQNVGYVIIRAGYRLGVPAGLAVVAAIGFSLLAAWTIHRLIEQPAMAWIRAKYKKSQVPQQFYLLLPGLRLQPQ